MTFYTHYNIGLERKDRYSKINVTHYSTTYNGKREVKPTSAREDAIIKDLKEMMEELSMNKLEVKLKEK